MHFWHHTFPNLVGLVGVVLCLTAYLLVQLRRLEGHSFTFAIVNFISSACVIYSLLFFWNLSSFVIEFFWSLISLIGVLRYIKTRARTKQQQ